MPNDVAATEPALSPSRSRRRMRMPLLLAGLVAAILIACWIYLTGGRYVSEEDSATDAATVLIAPEVSGKVVSRPIVEGQVVAAGALLFEIDPTPYRIARDTAKAQLANAMDQLRSLRATYDLKTSVIKQNQANEQLAQITYARMDSLSKDGTTTEADRDQALANLNVAKAAVIQAQSDAQGVLAQLGGSLDRPDEQQPSIQEASLALSNAQRNLDLTQVKAPFAGRLANVDTLQVGAEMAVGTTALALVATDKPWVIADLKETDLDGVVVGSPATVTIDAFPGVQWTGKVEAIGSATAASFAILPPQNATGNWVKVVQRVPVRVSLDPIDNGPEVSAGLSATVTVDTGRTRSLSTLFSDLAGLVGL